MKKILVLGVGAIGSTAVALVLGSGTALADDDVVGQTFAEAKTALSQQGLTPVVATTVGDRKDWDDCIVSSAFPAPNRDGYGAQSAAKMNVNLNCYATYSTGQAPGRSIQDPSVQDAYKTDRAAKKQQEAAAAAQAQAEQDQLAATDAQQGGE